MPNFINIPISPLIPPSGNYSDLFVNNIDIFGEIVPGGSNTQVQYNNNGLFGGSIDLTWNTNILTSNNSILSGTNLGFFDTTATQQNVDYPTLQSIVELLQAYGLCLGPPWSQQGSKLVGTGAIGPAFQGGSVSLSSDGNTLAVGGPTDNGGFSGQGATWIFTRTNSTWTQQGAKLIGSGGSVSAQQGRVTLSSDGNTLAVGGPSDDSGVGATWIFTRTNGVWSQQGSRLIGTGSSGNATQGISLALSSDGNTLAVGGYSDDSAIGAVWIFTRTSGVWSQQGSKLVGSGYTGSSNQGSSVSLSDTGNTLAIGGYKDDSNIGATWIFTRSGTTWSQQGSKLVGTGYIGESYQANSVSLSSDGDTLAVGGYNDNTGIGATWIFTRSGSTWSQQGSKILGTGYVGIPLQGFAVSLDSTGDTLIAGAPSSPDTNYIGTAFVFTRENGVWSQIGFKLLPTGYVATPSAPENFGFSVSLSKDGTTIASGAYGDNSFAGAAYVFAKRV